MTTQQMVRGREPKRNLLETQYRSIGISAVVAAVEGRGRPAKAKKITADELKFAERFRTDESD